MIKNHQRFDLFGKLCLERVVFQPPMRTPGLFPNEACFLYSISGRSRMFSGTEEVILECKEGIVMKCGYYFNEWIATSGQEEEGEAIAVHFHPEVIKKIYDKELPDFIEYSQQEKPAPIQKVKADQLLKNYIDNLLFYFENPTLVSEELLKLKIRELILLLVKTDNATSIQRLFSSLFTPTEYSFKEIIEANVFSGLTNEELAVLTNLSLSSFKREFEKVYQSSPAQYFKLRKLERARKLLRNTKQRIGDIAYDCGFKDVSHFSKSFQKKYGCTPSEYRLAQIDQ